VGKVPSNAREKKPWSTLSKKWIKHSNAIGNCSVKLEARGLNQDKGPHKGGPNLSQFELRVHSQLFHVDHKQLFTIKFQ